MPRGHGQGRLQKPAHVGERSLPLVSDCAHQSGTLLFFEGRCKETATLFFELLKFLHDELARLPQFEIYVAHRFFLLSSREPFFSPVQQNAMDLDRKIRSMAWDLTHWRSLFEMLAIGASFVGATPFPFFRTSCHSTDGS